MPDDRLSEDYIRKIARLSRLAIRDDEIPHYQSQLSAVLNYVQRLREIQNHHGYLPDARPGTATLSVDISRGGQGWRLAGVIYVSPVGGSPSYGQ